MLDLRRGVFIILAFFLLVLQGKAAQECHFAYSENLNLRKHNFGVLKYNNDFQIYRSAASGKGLKEIFNRIESDGYKVPKTLLYLHPKKYAFIKVEGDIAKKRKIQFIWSEDYAFNNTDEIENIEKIERILAFILEPRNQPVLFHCVGGRHRTGVIALLLRYLEAGCWTDDSFHKRILVPFSFVNMNRAQYEYYTFNRSLFRESDLALVQKLRENEVFKDFQEIYGEKLRESMPERKKLSEKFQAHIPSHSLWDFLYDMRGIGRNKK